MIGGLMGFGAFYSPAIRNLDITAGEAGSVVAGFAWDGPTEGWSWWGYVDGLPVGECGPGSPFVSDPLSDGGHDVRVVAWEDWVRPVPDIIGDFSGRRAYLDWSAASETDLAAYRVYWDEGDAGDADALLASVSVIEVQAADGGERPRLAAVSSGTGTGRLTVGGSYAGTAVNETWTVAVASQTGDGGTLTLDRGAGAGDAREWRSGVAVMLADGVWARLADDAADYDVGDEWEFRVGPRTWFLSGELEAGTYQFAVAPVDRAGNEGTATSAVSVVIAPGPDAPSGVVAVWNSVAETITITWTDPAALDDIVIYSNWNAVFEDIEPYVLEDSPLAVVSAATETYVLTLPGGTEGTFLFYVRARESGVEDGNASLIRVVASQATVADLGEPVVVEALPGAGGSLLVTAAVDLRDGTPDDLALYVFDTASPDWSIATAEEVVAFAGSGVPIATQTITAAGPFTGTKYVAVRAVDGGSNETGNTAVVAVTADSTAPSAVTMTAAAAT